MVHHPLEFEKAESESVATTEDNVDDNTELSVHIHIYNL